MPSFKKSNHHTMAMCYSLAAMVMLFALPSQAKECSQAEGFKQGAQDFVEVRYREKMRRGSIVKVVTQAEILWQPQEMLSAPGCYDLAAAELLLKGTDQKQWTVAKGEQISAGKSAKWTVDVKPCLQYQFRIQVTGNTLEGRETIFDIPDTLGPATEEEVLYSGYTPETPTNFRAEVGANSATLEWDPSHCAASYDVSYVAADEEQNAAVTAPVPAKGSSSVPVSGLQPCKRYVVTISAILGDEFSEDLIKAFATEPRLDAAADIQPEVIPGMQSVTVTWETWQSVSCIDQYKINICSKHTMECLPEATIVKPKGVSYVTHSFDGLESCTDYILEILPLFGDSEIESKMLEFRTLSPDVSTLSVERVSAKTVSTASMMVSWTKVNCAASYRVYQKETEAPEWSHVADTPAEDNEITVGNITPCTRYHFAISAVLADKTETDKSVGPELISDLDSSQPFEVPNLYIKNGDRHADISWGHADCISSYLIKVCQKDYTDCIEEQVDPSQNGDDRSVHKRIEGLDPCTHYTLEITPLITGKDMFTARPSEFSTTNGAPQPPEEFIAELKTDSAVALRWSRAQCATGYKVFQKLEETTGEEEEELDSATTSELGHEFPEPVPCHTYYYSVATMVDEQESARTEWFSLLIPPRPAEAPELKVISRDKSNVTVRMEPAPINGRCHVEEYELSYSEDGAKFEKRSLKPSELTEKGDVVLSFKGANRPETIISGRLRYAELGLWSESVSTGGISSHQRASNVTEDGMSPGTMAPIIVGVVVAIIIVIVIVIMTLRRRKGNNYDTEKAENGKNSHLVSSTNDEETEKLNYQPEA